MSDQSLALGPQNGPKLSMPYTRKQGTPQMTSVCRDIAQFEPRGRRKAVTTSKLVQQICGRCAKGGSNTQQTSGARYRRA